MTDRAPHAIALMVGVALLGFGAWAMLDPRAFYDGVATWPPYNRHFIHDVGAFQIGLGLTLLLALVAGDALLVALGGVGAGQTAHAVAHWIDRDLGGTTGDPWTMSVLAALLVAGAIIRRRGRRRASFRRF